MIRIVSRLDIKGPNVIKGVFAEGLKIVGDPRELALKYYNQGADEILYMDVVASLYQRNLDFDLLRSVTENVFVPVTVGGGIRSVNDIANALRSGADKVAINTYAIAHPEFLKEAVRKFGSQCIVLSVEAKNTGSGTWEAYTNGGRERTGKDAIAWIREAIALGIGEIVITSIDRDGTQKGYDQDLIKAIIPTPEVPIIVHGGAGSLGSIKEVLKNCMPDAISLASVLHFGDLDIKSIKKFLAKHGFDVRTD